MTMRDDVIEFYAIFNATLDHIENKYDRASYDASRLIAIAREQIAFIVAYECGYWITLKPGMQLWAINWRSDNNDVRPDELDGTSMFNEASWLRYRGMASE